MTPYYASKIVLGYEDTSVNKTEHKPCPSGAATLWNYPGIWAEDALASWEWAWAVPLSFHHLHSHPEDADTRPDLRRQRSLLDAQSRLPFQLMSPLHSSSCFVQCHSPQTSCDLFFNNTSSSQHSPGVTPLKCSQITLSCLQGHWFPWQPFPCRDSSAVAGGGTASQRKEGTN